MQHVEKQLKGSTIKLSTHRYLYLTVPYERAMITEEKVESGQPEASDARRNKKIRN